MSHTYDPKQVVCTFGNIILSGFADGTFITAERDEDAFSRKVGAAGEACWVRNNNRGGAVTFTTMQDSQTNDVLSTFAAADDLNGTGVQSFFMKDLTGTSLVHAGECRIKKMPKLERGKELAEVEWQLDCADLDIFLGGLLT